MQCTLLRLFKYHARRAFLNLLPAEVYCCGFQFLILIFFVAGCSTPMAGLQPQYPPFEKSIFSRWGNFVEVDSLQPTLRWQPFSPPQDRTVTTAGMLTQIEGITYELRIWKTKAGMYGDEVYARDGMKLPYHKLEEPLEPSTRYLWSVRAHFLLDGHPRTIEWGIAGSLVREETVPNPSCYRFVTP
jgi:hypothetical protein